MNPTALGSGSRVLNAYAARTTARRVYEGQRAAAPDQRVFILTRSGFAGQQRYAAATWSGDITSTWTALRQQIAAGPRLLALRHAVLDHGHRRLLGARRASRARTRRPEDVEEWRELNTRWFQFGTFVPAARASTARRRTARCGSWAASRTPPTRPSSKFDRLRYRLLPYIYSLAGAVTPRGRHDPAAAGHGLPDDATARGDQRPVPVRPRVPGQPGDDLQGPHAARSTCPPARDWYDFWTGDGCCAAGRRLDAAAPVRRDPAPREGRLHPALRPGAAVHGREARRPAHARRLHRRRRRDSPSTRTTASATATRRAPPAASRSSGTTKARTLTSRRAPGVVPRACSRSGRSRSCSCRGRRPVPFSFELRPQRTVRYDGEAIEVRLK